MRLFLRDAEMAAVAGRASPGDREVHLRMHGNGLVTKRQISSSQQSLRQRSSCWGLAQAGSEGRPREWLGRQEGLCSTGGAEQLGGAAGVCLQVSTYAASRPRIQVGAAPG